MRRRCDVVHGWCGGGGGFRFCVGLVAEAGVRDRVVVELGRDGVVRVWEGRE